jgi:hypothetical protein
MFCRAEKEKEERKKGRAKKKWKEKFLNESSMGQF